MLRIVVMGQPGMFGRLWCRRAAVRLAKRLKLPCIDAEKARADSTTGTGWVTVAAIGEFPSSVLRIDLGVDDLITNEPAEALRRVRAYEALTKTERSLRRIHAWLAG